MMSIFYVFVGLIYVFFCKVSLQILHPLLNGVVCFFPCKSVLVLCRFWIAALCQMGKLQKFFPHSVGCQFTPMIVSSAVQKLWSLIRYHFSILAFVAIAFGVLVMKSLSMPMSWIYCLGFLLGFYDVRSYAYIFNLSGVNFCIRCKERIQFSLSVYG